MYESARRYTKIENVALKRYLKNGNVIWRELRWGRRKGMTEMIG